MIVKIGSGGMVKKNSYRKTQVAQRHKPSIPDKDLGHDAAIHPDITEVYPERDRLLLLELPETAIAELATMVSRSLIQDQRQQWVNAKLNGSDTNILFYSQEDRMTAYFEILQDKTLKLYGNVIYHQVDPETGEPLTELPVPPIYQITIEEAQANGYPIPNPIPDGVNSRSPYLVIHLRLPQRGQTGQQGQQGIQGIQGQQGQQGQQGIQGIAGPKGDQGDPGNCTDCIPPGGTNPIGPTGPDGDGGGSGPGGSPAPDDIVVYVAGCPSPIIDFPYCSGSFTFANADLREPIAEKAQATGKFDPVTETLVSAVIEWSGAGYGGVASVTVDTQEGYTGQGSALATVLNVTDASGANFEIPYTAENFGVADVLVVRGYHYNGATGIRLLPSDAPVVLNGTVSQYPILGAAACRNPPDANDPAWLKACLRQFVKKSGSSSCIYLAPYTIPQFYANPDAACWYGGTAINAYGGVYRLNNNVAAFTSPQIYSNVVTHQMNISGKLAMEHVDRDYLTVVDCARHGNGHVLGDASHTYHSTSPSGAFDFDLTVVFDEPLPAFTTCYVDVRVFASETTDLGPTVNITLS